MDNRAALVVGGASGIGLAVSRRLAASGWYVHIADVKSAERVAAEIRDAGHQGEGHVFDLSQTELFASFFERREMASLRATVITAAILGPLVPLSDYDRATWDRVIAVNLTGTFFCAQAAANRMAANGGGRLILFGSGAGRIPVKSTIAPYIASKAAIETLVYAFTNAYASKNVLVAGISPGRTRTPMVMGPVYTDEASAITPNLPLKRLLEPDEVAAVVDFLCSDAANGVTNAFWGVSTPW